MGRTTFKDWEVCRGLQPWGRVSGPKPEGSVGLLDRWRKEVPPVLRPAGTGHSEKRRQMQSEGEAV